MCPCLKVYPFGGVSIQAQWVCVIVSCNVFTVHWCASQSWDSINNLFNLSYLQQYFIDVNVTLEQHQQHRVNKRHISKYYELHLNTNLLKFASSSSSSSSATSSLSVSSSSSKTSREPTKTQLLPEFLHEPYGRVRFSNFYGGLVPCSVRFTISSPSHRNKIDTSNVQIKRIFWEVRDSRTLDDSHFATMSEIVGLREQRPDGALAFLPFNYENSLISNELKSGLYRCVVVTNFGTLASRTIHVSLGKFGHN